MTMKTRGSEKMLFSCDKNGKRSLADFENAEEALQASGGMHGSLGEMRTIWEKLGQPTPDIFDRFSQLQNVKEISSFSMR